MIDHLPSCYDVDIIKKELFDLLASTKGIALLSVIFSDIPIVLPIIEKVKAKYPENIIVLGGPGVTSISQIISKRFPSVDAIVEGEGEDHLPLLIQNLILRHNNTKTKILTKDMCPRLGYDQIYMPAYHLIDNWTYRIASIGSARGCCYSCVFCSIPAMWGAKIAYRDISSLVDEIEILQLNHNIHYYSIIDDVFIINERRVIEFCSELRKRNISIKWDVFGRVDVFDPYLLAAMVENGLVNIYFGIESGSDAVLREINKQFNIEQAIKVVSVARKFCAVSASFVWGFPFESLDDFKKTLELMNHFRQFNNVELQHSSLCPFPGTPVFEKYKNSLWFNESMVSRATGFRREDIASFCDFLRQNKDICAGFYHLYHDELLQKWQLAQEQEC